MARIWPSALLFLSFVCVFTVGQSNGQETFTDAINLQFSDETLQAQPDSSTGTTAQPNTLASPLVEDFAPNKLRTQSTSDDASESKEKKFADKFWNYLLSNNYKHWAPLPETPASFFTPSNNDNRQVNPHGTLAKIYSNRLAAGNDSKMPHESIVILENYNSDRSLRSISVMYRSPGFNPNAKDWFWADFQPDGTVTRRESESLSFSFSDDSGVRQATAMSKVASKTNRIAGRENSCIQCHQTAGGSDFVFSNDSREFVTGDSRPKVRSANPIQTNQILR